VNETWSPTEGRLFVLLDPPEDPRDPEGPPPPPPPPPAAATACLMMLLSPSTSCAHTRRQDMEGGETSRQTRKASRDEMDRLAQTQDWNAAARLGSSARMMSLYALAALIPAALHCGALALPAPAPVSALVAWDKTTGRLH